MIRSHVCRAAIASATLALVSCSLALDANAKTGPIVRDHTKKRAQVTVPWKPNPQGPANSPSPPRGPVVRVHK
jgi:hypothetical protein